MKPGRKGPRRLAVERHFLTAAEKRAAGLFKEQEYWLLTLSCGHHVLRRGLFPSALCGHCGKAGHP